MPPSTRTVRVADSLRVVRFKVWVPVTVTTSEPNCRRKLMASRKVFWSGAVRVILRRTCASAAFTSNRMSKVALPLVSPMRSEEHTSELQSRLHLVCRLLLEKKKKKNNTNMVMKCQCTQHLALECY